MQIPASSSVAGGVRAVILMIKEAMAEAEGKEKKRDCVGG